MVLRLKPIHQCVADQVGLESLLEIVADITGGDDDMSYNILAGMLVSADDDKIKDVLYDAMEEIDLALEVRLV